MKECGKESKQKLIHKLQQKTNDNYGNLESIRIKVTNKEDRRRKRMTRKRIINELITFANKTTTNSNYY